MAEEKKLEAPASPLHRTVQFAAGLVIVTAGLHFAATTANLVLISILLAMTFSPIPDLLGRRGMKHGAAVMVTVLGVLVGGVLLIGVLGSSLTRMSEKLPGYEATLAGMVDGASAWLQGRGIDVHEVFKPDTARVARFVGGLVGGALSALGYSFLVLILVVLFLLEMPTGRTDASLQGRYQDVAGSVRGFVGITGLMGAGQAAFNLVAMLLVGTDFAFVWAVLFFLLNFVPFGFVIGLIPPLVVTLLEQGPTRAGILVVLLFVANLISDNVIKPKVMGAGLGLSPLVIVLSLLFWSFVLGAVGAILAVPLTLAISRVLPQLTGSHTQAGAPPE